MITIQISQPWQVRTPEVYRYLEQEYVDEFFSTGRLRLSSFTSFKEHDDEMRGDASEGQGLLTGVGDETTLFAVVKQDARSLIMSTTTRCDTELMEEFGYDSCFKINDTTNFAAAVSRAIPLFQRGIEGPCIYQGRKLEREIEDLDFDALREENDGEIPMDEVLQRVSSVAASDLPFLKPESYAQQAEYRFIWRLSEMGGDHMYVECPDARQFCEPVSV